MILVVAFASLFLQVGSVPIWVPLLFILLILIVVWWGLTRNFGGNDSEPAGPAEIESDNLLTSPELTSQETQSNNLLTEESNRRPKENAQADGVGHHEGFPESFEPHDFKVIEGIGPKIAIILAEAGITTFDQLANTEVAELERIVRVEAGIRVADPASWPQQAAFAADGDWVGLKEMQRELVAGRHRP